MASAPATRVCGHCGQVLPAPTIIVRRPWHVRNRASLFAYVESLSEETHEWLLALFVGDNLELISVETIARGTVSDCPVDVGRIYCRGRAIGAKGLFLVHNHPSGDPRPSRSDRLITVKMARTFDGLDMPLLDHFIVAGGKIVAILLE